MKRLLLFLIIFFVQYCGLYNPNGPIPSNIISITPADLSTGVSETQSISIVFSQAMDASSLTTNSSSSTCTGSIQLSLSSANFSSCIGLGSVSASNGAKTFTVSSSSSLSSSTTYKIKITTDAKTSYGGISFIEKTYSFTTGDSLGPVVSSITPDNASTAVATTLDNITLIFNESITESSLTVNTSDTTCSGYSLQLSSSSSFASCVQISSLTSRFDNDTQFELALSSELSPLTKYYLKITTGITDSSGNSVTESIFDFTIDGAIYLHQNASGVQGNIGNRATANGLCDSNKPAWVTTSVALISYDASDEVRDLPSTASVPTSYVVKWFGDNSTVSDNFTDMFTATSGSTGGLDAALNAKTGWLGGTTVMTGSNTDGSTRFNCSNWTVNNSITSVMLGAVTLVNNPDWIGSIQYAGCDASRYILCVSW